MLTGWSSMYGIYVSKYEYIYAYEHVDVSYVCMHVCMYECM